MPVKSDPSERHRVRINIVSLAGYRRCSDHFEAFREAKPVAIPAEQPTNAARANQRDGGDLAACGAHAAGGVWQ